MTLLLKGEERAAFARGFGMMAFSSLGFFIAFFIVTVFSIGSFRYDGSETLWCLLFSLMLISAVLQTIGYSTASRVVEGTPIASAIKTLRVMTIINYTLPILYGIFVLTDKGSVAPILFLLWLLSLVVSFILGITTTNKIANNSSFGGTVLTRTGYIIQLSCMGIMILVLIILVILPYSSSRHSSMVGVGYAASGSVIYALLFIFVYIAQILVCIGNLVMAYSRPVVEIYVSDDEYIGYTPEENTDPYQTQSTGIDLDKPSGE